MEIRINENDIQPYQVWGEYEDEEKIFWFAYTKEEAQKYIDLPPNNRNLAHVR